MTTNEVYTLLGVEDGSFKGYPRLNFGNTLLCVVKMVGPTIEEVRFAKVTIDGFDATENLLKVIDNLFFDAVILGGISFAGFNIIDAKLLNKNTGKPVIVYMGKKPNSQKMYNALKKIYTDWEKKWKCIIDLGELYSVKVKDSEPKIFYEIVGESKEWGFKVLKYAAMLCRIPEPVRVANIIAKSVTQNC
ncbi:DUF99 family protein [Candidatus Bathyarchaeota archaeon]|nr:DUF99 family protein [Candidatus Bathyarchaeota archaeon]